MAKKRLNVEPRQTTIRIPPPLLKAIKDAAFDRRVPAQTVMIEALAKHFGVVVA